MILESKIGGIFAFAMVSLLLFVNPSKPKNDYSFLIDSVKQENIKIEEANDVLDSSVNNKIKEYKEFINRHKTNIRR